MIPILGLDPTGEPHVFHVELTRFDVNLEISESTASEILHRAEGKNLDVSATRRTWNVVLKAHGMGAI